MDLQEDSRACGKAVARAAVKWFWPRRTGEYVSIDTPCGSFAELKAALGERGVTATGFEDMTPARALGKGHIAILQRQDKDRFHFVLGLRRFGHRIAFFDPARGMVLLAEDEFKTAYTGRALVLAKGAKPPRKNRPPRLNTGGQTAALAFTAALRAFFVYFFLLALDQPEATAAGLLFLVCAGLTVIISFLAATRFFAGFLTRTALPATLRGRGAGAYADMERAKSLALGLDAAVSDRLGFFGVCLAFLAREDRGLLWLFVAVMALTGAICALAAPALEALRAQSGYWEEAFLEAARDNPGQAAGALKKTRTFAFAYAGGSIARNAIPALFAAGAALWHLSGYEGLSLTVFLSCFAFLEGSALNLGGLFREQDRLAELRKCLYRLGPEFARTLEKDRRKWYSLSAGKTRGKKQKQ